MKTGTVVTFNKAEGFGFLEDQDGMVGDKDYFVHFSNIIMEGYKFLEQGQRVTFEVEIGPKGKPQATQVRVIEDEVE